jgi:hypothetical protein
VRDKRRTPRCAVTVLELLVGMALVGAFIALLLPAIQGVRKSSNRITVSNKLDAIEEICMESQCTDRAAPSVATASGHVTRGKVRYTVDVRLSADDFDKASTELLRIAGEHKDLMVKFDMPPTSEPSARRCWRISVPTQFMSQMIDLLAKHGQGQRGESHVHEQDLATRFLDLDARLAKQRSHEEVLRDYLEEQNRWAHGPLDVREIEEELTATRWEIDRMQAERHDLETTTAFCTVTMTIEQAKIKPSGKSVPGIASSGPP